MVDNQDFFQLEDNSGNNNGILEQNSQYVYDNMSNAHSYQDILRNVQEYVSNNYKQYFINGSKKFISFSDSKNGDDEFIDKNEKIKYEENVKDIIRRYIINNKIKCTDKLYSLKNNNNEIENLVDSLYLDMAGFSFISNYLDKNVINTLQLEEININAWNDIEIIAKGKKIKLKEKFLSPQHAIDVIRRMLQQSDTVIDDSNPTALGSLAKNVRITVLKTPILDEDVGVSASIRIVSASRISKDLLLKNTATDDMLDFLYNIIKYGVSVCIAGNTGSGKTSTASWLLSTIPNNKRIYTIEQGSREFDLVKHSEKDGSIVNSVIHTLTKSSNDPKNEITQQKLLDLALRFNPDVICVGEMRSDEAFAAQEAARTGHTVITTIHSKNAVGTYMRMTTLAKRAYEFTDETLMRLMIEAFPIIVYQHQMEDSSRKITEIIEGEGYKDGKVIYRTLFKYVVDDNIISNGKKTVLGHFENPNGISQELRDELMQNGMPKNIVDRFYKG
jgi:pilus assembly protein CpaF